MIQEDKDFLAVGCLAFLLYAICYLVMVGAVVWVIVWVLQQMGVL